MKYELDTLTDYSDDALLAEVRRVASVFRGEKLTHREFNRLSRVHSTTLRKRFGSWEATLDKTGISEALVSRQRQIDRHDILDEIKTYVDAFPDVSPTVREVAARMNIDTSTIFRRFGTWSELLKEAGLKPAPLGRRYSDEQCFENVVKLWAHYGRQPHFSELNQPPSLVGSKAYIRRWGGWRNALRAFVECMQMPSAERTEKRSDSSDVDAPDSGTVLHNPRSLSLALRYRVLVRDKFRCQICGRSPAKHPDVDLHVDHIIPWSKGGQNVEDNLRTLCSSCNLGKGSKIESSLLVS